jgi:hypothetical protein
MKTSKIIYGILFLFVSGCNQHKADSVKDEHDGHSATTEQPNHSNEKTLTINEGKKWNMDDPTRTNINAIKQVFEKAAKETGPDYLKLAAQLQSATNKLVSECKMSGKDHDMLHVWLENYLSALKDLKSSEAKVQQAAFHKVEGQLNSFDQYFE